MSKAKKNILIFSLFFSPSAEIGGKRFTFLAPLLQERGFNVQVLTLPETCYRQKDYSLVSVVPVFRAPIIPYIMPLPWGSPPSFLKKALGYIWSNYLSIIDIHSGWILPSFLKGLEIHRKQPIDVIIVTGPPFSPMISAFLLSRITGAKLILDYRDPWTTPPGDTRTYPKIFGKKINAFLERHIIPRAAGIVLVTETMRDDFLRFFGPSFTSICHVINNGYHPETKGEARRLEDNKKVIFYQGRFYIGKSVETIIEALLDLIKSHEIERDAISIHLFGDPLPEAERTRIASAGLNMHVIEHPWVDYATLQGYMKGADVLYLPSGICRYTVPGKFYEYLSVRRPILAVGQKDSEIAHMMRRVDCGEFAAMDDKDSIKGALRCLLIQNKQYSFAGAERYTWHNNADKYANLITQILKN